MAFDIAGTFTRLFNWQTDRDNAIKIRADRMDQEMDGFATGLSQTVLRDGRAAMTGTLSMGTHRITNVSSGLGVGNPDITFGDLTTGVWGGVGVYSGNAIGMSVGGNFRFRIEDQAVTFASGTVNSAVSHDVFGISQTWNNAATTLNGLAVNITNTNSAAASRLFKVQVGGATKFDIDTSGIVTAAGNVVVGGDAYHGSGLTSGRYTVPTSAGPNMYITAGAGATDFPEIMIGKSQNAAGVLGNIAWFNPNMAGASGTDKRTVILSGSRDTADDAGAFGIFTKAGGGAFSERMHFNSTGGVNVAGTFAAGTAAIGGGWTGNGAISGQVNASAWAGSFYNTFSSGGALLLRVDNTAANLASMNFNGSTVGSITTNGTTTAYNTSSDYRLKTNIVPFDNGLEYVMQLRPVVFDWLATEEVEQTQGFLAHEVQAVYDQAVYGQKDAIAENGEPIYQGIDHSKLVPMLVAALQELKRDFDAYKATHP